MTAPGPSAGSDGPALVGSVQERRDPVGGVGPRPPPPPRSRPRSRPFDPTWCLVADTDEDMERVVESLLCLADGVIGTRGVLEENRDPDARPVTVAGLYEPAGGVGERLMTLPSWCALPLVAGLPAGRRILDLRDGVLTRDAAVDDVTVRTVRFSCAARPGTAVLIAELDPRSLAEPPEAWAPATSACECRSPFGGGATGAGATALTVPAPGPERPLTVERIVAHVGSPARLPARKRAERLLAEASEVGTAGLLAEQRDAWRRRWEEADIEVIGDAESTVAARFAVFHLLSSVRRRGETALGARGLTGPAYAGHVFWDTEAFVLPVLAAVDRRAARTVLEYRIRRRGAARGRALRQGREGARFPWESAHSGVDVTPRSGIDQHGDTVSIRTGELEEHVTADVAWAAWRHAAWGGSWSFLAGPGRLLVVDTARYWASRARWDGRGRAHIDSVTGPDEYHPEVDDNAFTNLMARWNLRRAAELVDRTGAVDDEGEEAERWRHTADALVDNLDPATGRYEQFAGYDLLEPLRVADLGTPPLAADLVLGPERTARSQVIKQADVLMAHLMIPDGVAPGSLAANLDHYLPRTAHGSSLSPAVHAALLARAGRPSEALELLRVAWSIDLDDLTETTGGGLHLANLGGIWQAMVHGFAGLSVAGPDDPVLSLAPVLPESWGELRVRFRWHGRRVRLACRASGVYVGTDRPLVATVHGTRARIEPPGGWVG